VRSFGGVKGRALLSLLQQRLASYYALEASPDVLDFVRAVADDEREVLLVREQDDAVELALLLPERLLEDGTAIDSDATRLELELQAEVDKFVLLALAEQRTGHAERVALHRTLFEQVRYLHQAGSEEGDRYRLANDLAARYVRRFDPAAPGGEVRAELCRFYRASQGDKIRMARAA
jgi:hypothetical protein